MFSDPKVHPYQNKVVLIQNSLFLLSKSGNYFLRSGNWTKNNSHFLQIESGNCKWEFYIKISKKTDLTSKSILLKKLRFGKDFYTSGTDFLVPMVHGGPSMYCGVNLIDDVNSEVLEKAIKWVWSWFYKNKKFGKSNLSKQQQTVGEMKFYQYLGILSF